MIRVPKLKIDENMSPQKAIPILVRQVNMLSQALDQALSNIGIESIYTDEGVSLEDLYAAGALKGDPGETGAAGKVYRPTVTVEGVISWALTDEGGTVPASQNIKGPTGEKGQTGDTGPKGDTGLTGVGVPAGGTTGQVLKKASDNDYDTVWVTP